MDTLKKRTVLTLDSLKILTGKSKVLRVFPKVLTENSKVRTVHDAAPPNPCTKGHCYSRCDNNRAEGTQNLGADALKYALP